MCALHESEVPLDATTLLSTDGAILTKHEHRGAAAGAGGEPGAKTGSITALARLLETYTPTAAGHTASEYSPGEGQRAIYRRRRWSQDEKKSIVCETEQTGQSVSGVARKYGIAPRLLFSWRRQLAEELALTNRYSTRMVPAVQHQELSARLQELEQLLSVREAEIETLTQALALVKMNSSHAQEPCYST